MVSSEQGIDIMMNKVTSITSTSPVTTIPLPDWIHGARLNLTKKDYLECAIVVASNLTHRLIHIVCVDQNAHEPQLSELSSGSSSLILAQIEDIVPNNVLVSVASTNSNTPDQSSPVDFRASDVNIIQPSAADSNLCDIFEIPQLSERNVCFALGKILFELFSEGNSSLLAGIESQNNENSIDRLQIGGISSNDRDDLVEQNDEQGDDLEDIITLPVLKRFLSNIAQTGSSIKSNKANEYLQKQALPLSICQLVSDLLDAEEGNPYVPDTALLSLEEAKHDLMQMNAYPQRFLYDHFSPKEALDKTCLFTQIDGKLYGRGNELGTLMGIVTRISTHDPSLQNRELLYEAAFLEGHSGSGKSSIIKRIVSYWKIHGWSMVFCKFDRQGSPLSTLLQAFDESFGKFIPKKAGGKILERGSALQETFDRIFNSIMPSLDRDSFNQLCQLLPRFAQLFPYSVQYSQQKDNQNGSSCCQDEALQKLIDATNQPASSASTGNVGSGRHRLLNLFRILFKALCGAGHPILFCVEDLQWVDQFTMDVIIQGAGSGSAFSEQEYLFGGMLLLGSFRDSVPEDGFLMNRIKLLEQSINVTKLSVGELPLQDINHMLSFKFCLPTRHTRDLAQLVYQKTRGNAMFIIEFLRFICTRNLMTFSVKSRRWTWDDTTIDLQMITEGVVELLTKKLKQLPSNVVEALKVASCFGHVNVSTVHLLDFGQFVPNVLEALESACQEGIMEKAGPMFAFSHDMLQESTYSLIPPDERMPLHKKIGMNLVLQYPNVAANPEVCTLAVDQCNICKDAGIMDQAERTLFARLNLAAGKHSMSTKRSNYQQAREYFEAGISLLHTDHWAKQYALSLELFERSVIVSFMDGNLEAVSSRLNEILSNTLSSEDEVNPRVLLAKFLASQEQYADATDGVLRILTTLGECFPKEVTPLLVTEEINALLPVLEGITKESIMNLPAMNDRRTLKAMKFMDLLSNFSNFSSPLLMHLVSCRMTKLTFSYGFCGEYSISGLAFMSHGLLQYSNDSHWQANHISKIAEYLTNRDPNSHSLRARLALMISSVQCFIEPAQAAAAKFMDGYYSATIAGDIDNALFCGLWYCAGSMFCTTDILVVQKKLGNFLPRLVKHKRIGHLHAAMSYFDAYATLIGIKASCGIDARIKMKSNKELYHIAKQTKNSHLMHQVALNQIFVHCFFREYLECASLAEKYQITRTAKRTFDFLLVFYTGISALNLARDTMQEKWRIIGKNALKIMSGLVKHSTWNFESKSKLLQAELYYVEGRHRMAELAYQSSIESAHNHKYVHEEALARELFAMFLLENKCMVRGLDQLRLAHDKYKQWGALEKANAVKDFIDMVSTVRQFLG